MDWKTVAIEKLRDYEARKAALENIPLELKRLEAAYTGIRAAQSDASPAAGDSGSRREDALLSNIVRRDELKRRLREARLWVVQVDKALAVLDDEERLTLELCFVHRVKGAVADLCERLGVEKSAVYRRRDQALRRFTIALYGTAEAG